MYLRRRKLMQPLPPLPPSTRIMASSTNFIVLAYGTDSRVTHKKPGEIFDAVPAAARSVTAKDGAAQKSPVRSEEHTSELQSLMRISYAVFCLKKKTHNQ